MCQRKLCRSGKILVKIHLGILEKKDLRQKEGEEGSNPSIALRVIQTAYRTKIKTVSKKYETKLKQQS